MPELAGLFGLLEHADVTVRAKALAALVRLPLDETAWRVLDDRVLVALTEPSSFQEKVSAIAAAGRAAGSEVRERLVEQLEAEPELAEASAFALGELADDRAAPALAMRLEHAELHVRRRAAWALSRLDWRRETARIGIAFERETDSYAELAEGLMLGQFATIARAFDALPALAASDGDVLGLRHAVAQLRFPVQPEVVAALEFSYRQRSAPALVLEALKQPRQASGFFTTQRDSLSHQPSVRWSDGELLLNRLPTGTRPGSRERVEAGKRLIEEFRRQPSAVLAPELLLSVYLVTPPEDGWLRTALAWLASHLSPRILVSTFSRHIHAHPPGPALHFLAEIADQVTAPEPIVFSAGVASAVPLRPAPQSHEPPEAAPSAPPIAALGVTSSASGARTSGWFGSHDGVEADDDDYDEVHSEELLDDFIGKS